MKYKLLFFLIVLILSTACKTADVNYLQNIESIAVKTSTENSRVTLNPGDLISVSITANDMEVVKPFVPYTQRNQSEINNKNAQNNQNTQSIPEYLVDNSGNITFPILGKIHVLGKTSEEVKSQITDLLKNYIKDPIVSVNLNNFKVTVLGEVTRPNTYPMQERATLLEAIGVAGDLTIYGERKNILLVRNENGEITKQYIDITDARFINSPYYFLKQNDVIYVSANKAKANSSKYGSETSIYITIGSVIISVLLTVITLVKN